MFLVLLLYGCKNQEITTKVASTPTTFCNPIDLNYRFMIKPKAIGIREAADPVVIQFKDKFYLFASKSSGYWSTSDFISWKQTFIDKTTLPIENYAPAVYASADSVYYLGPTHGNIEIYRSADPETGKWEKGGKVWTSWDPTLYVENDMLYLYYGCSPSDPIFLQKYNWKSLQKKGERISCIYPDTKQRGWERPGEFNELKRAPWVEGAWMTKHNNRYYLQYAVPGTEWKSYADGVFVSDNPEGPFEYASQNPVSYKPTGFVGGAGHGCIFQVGDNYWKAATNSVSVRDPYERRVSFYPAGFDNTEAMYTDTYLGDYPLYLPSAKPKSTVRPNWMLLSYHKTVSASSTSTGKVESIVDENIRTAWAATSNKPGEWVSIDLGKKCKVHAIQVNYDEHATTLRGYQDSIYQAYQLYASHDGKKWYSIADFSEKRTDNPHHYVEFEKPFHARYIKWENKAYNISPKVSLRELRVFGLAKGKKPAQLKTFSLDRNTEDPTVLTVSWEPVEGATGYIIREGVNKDHLFHNYQVTDNDSYKITSLNATESYYIAIDTYNECGITQGVVQKIAAPHK